MLEIEKKQFIARLRRLSGQARSLEASFLGQSPDRFIAQLEAVIAASKASLSSYAEIELINSKEESDKKLLLRLIKKV